MYRIYSVFQYSTPDFGRWWIYSQECSEMLGLRNFACVTIRSPFYHSRYHAVGIPIKVWSGLRVTSELANDGAECQYGKISRSDTEYLFGSVEMDARCAQCCV